MALSAASIVAAESLTVQGARFAVDGTPRFLTFISYFGAMGAADVAADLAFLKDAGFDGVRVWPNSPEGPQLMRSDGSLEESALARLHAILAEAGRQRLIVDVSFTAEHIDGLSAGAYEQALARAAVALRGNSHALFDLQNERNLRGPRERPLSAEETARMVSAIKRADPSRIVTASSSQDEAPGRAAAFSRAAALDVLAYHDPRVASWHEDEQVRSVVSALKAGGVPVYLQEPTRYPFAGSERAEHFRRARASAARAGAAAWCFHTDLGFDLRGARFEERLRSRPEPEWAFVTSLREQRGDVGANVTVPESSPASAQRAPKARR